MPVKMPAFIVSSLWILVSLLVLAKAEIVQKVSNSGDLCSKLCKCPNSGNVFCDSLANTKLIFEHLPHGTRLLQVRNVSHVIIASQAVKKLEDDLVVAIFDVSYFDCQSQAFELVSGAKLKVSVESVVKVGFERHSISGKAGSFSLGIVHAQDVFLTEDTFDVLTSVQMRNIQTLLVSSGSFKPVSVTPDLIIELNNVTNIPKLNSGTFSSAKDIFISDARIKEIESNAFSGIQFGNITFESCSVDRLSSNAFPMDKLISSLSFNRCNFSSIAEESVNAAMSILTIDKCRIASLSQRGFNCHVAKVQIVNSDFNTLGNHSLVMRSWNDFRMLNNTINFMESDSLMGITSPGQDINATFTLVNNDIVYANRYALRTSLSDEVELVVSSNQFHRECDCGEWMTYLSGQELLDQLITTSLCKVPKFLTECFGDDVFTQVQTYSSRFCSSEFAESSNECGKSKVWSMVEDQIEINTNKGILLTILLAAIFFSLIVSIYTLIRKLVYAIQLRCLVRKEDEWNFTKIEERQLDKDDSSTSEEHYEKLPLTTDSHCHSPDSNVSTNKEHDADTLKSDLGSEQKPSLAVAVVEPPKLTFYDEMIDMLKEKLDDPDNYATVADTRTAFLYQDPMDIKPETESKDTS